MKKFRKISSLALVLVLVCLCATAAFATSFSYDYDVADGYVNVSGNMTQYSVSGQIYVNDGYDTGDLRRVSIDFWYIQDNGSSTSVCQWDETTVKSIYSGHAAVAEKTLTAAEIDFYDIVCMSYGEISFRAYVPYMSGFGSELYADGPFYVSYLIP